jgi:hypothetical protein
MAFSHTHTQYHEMGTSDNAILETWKQERISPSPPVQSLNLLPALNMPQQVINYPVSHGM